MPTRPRRSGRTSSGWWSPDRSRSMRPSRTCAARSHRCSLSSQEELVLPNMMRAWRRFGPDDVRLVEIERPEPGPGEVLLRPILSGVCGTDLHVLHGEGLGDLPVPLTMGHEVCGEVVALGEGADAPGPYPRSAGPLQPGDRVVVEPVLPCGTCFFCRRAHPNVCPSMSHLGIWRDGNYADYVAVPSWRATRLPGTVDAVSGVPVEVTACALNCVDRAQLRPGE